ncbi:CoA transferase [Arthrobacter sp. AZCC_0090]|uniref:CoA transferase n=1 Tax=Arthrobacter sp. AZCC_0090 TaxID=2735881 RepID=UPI0016141540|nr:CoA transferase [Arthrobacter sp. AZCC_0090]MBB6405911.1 crotonobetainyl-CoA:carnitine CoA-transferase CaiB-like acyl-CoA transferase [Arthrobacter sp. AZCC_0090]
MNDSFADVISRVWHAIGADDDNEDWPATQLTTTGPRAVLPAAFDVTGLATGAVAVATVAAAQFLAARRDSRPQAVTVNSREACAAFTSERLFTPIGWTQPPLWDPIAGNYRAADAWIRLHTNYANHRAAVEQVLGAHDRETVEAAVAGLRAEELETAIVEAGGCAAVMHNRRQWLASAPGAATADAPPLTVVERQSPGIRTPNAVGQLPFDGVRVLDLTRVIAGPVCTKFLAGYGADVLRIDPPGFDEVPSLLPETTLGKRTAALDLTASSDRATFEELLAGADVLVSGLRGDALKGLGYDDEALTAVNPGLIIASLDAYGWDGPWRNRRGFDSLVQMSCGIADDGANAMGRAEPTPLPVQALDHATGWLLAAAVARALTRRLTHSVTARIQSSLIGTANLLYSLTPPSEHPPTPAPEDFTLVATNTAWGPARRVPLPGRIGGAPAHWSEHAGPLGRHPARWVTHTDWAAFNFARFR